MTLALNLWGPALLVCFTLLIGVIYQNNRITDMKDSFNKRLDDMQASFNKRLDDLKDLIRSEFKRVDERIDRLESPIVRQ